MLHHNFKTAFRFANNHKGYFGINMIGLAIGLCVCFFASLYVNFELSYDSYHEKAGQIYRLVTDVKTSTGIHHQSSSARMASAMKASFPEVQTATRVFLDYLIVQRDHLRFGEENVAYADSSLFSVFTLPLLQGNPETMLNAPWNIVLSETAAHRYFGSDDPMGKSLVINGSETAFVTGVMKDMPYNSHFRVDILISMSSLIMEKNYSSWMSPWKRFGFYTYLVLPENYDVAQLNSKLPNFVKNLDAENSSKYTLQLEALKSIYFHSDPRGSRTGSSVHGNINNVYIFSVVAAFVLFIASFNFINLSTAFSLHRAKEIGVRKVLGSSKKQLIIQFLTDAVLLCITASFLALLLSIVFLPLFNSLTGKIITLNIFGHLNYIFFLFILALTIGLLSGIYPAFFLSGFHPISSLKGRFIGGSKGQALRKGLIITQFCIAIILISSTIVVYLQLHYMRNHALGFKKDHMLVIDFQFDDNIIKRDETIKQELSNIPGVGHISMSSCIPGRANHKFPTQIENAADEIQELQSDAYYVDYDFLKQYEIEILEGRAFSKQFASDLKKSMLINEAAASALGYDDPTDAIGKQFWQRGDTGLVIGVVKDFHFHSFREKVRPLTLQVAPGFFTLITLTVSAQNLPATVKKLEGKWRELSSDIPLVYFFADETYNNQYIEEERFGKLFTCFASLAIIISCLGLIGLSAFSIVQRTKEIGVRKILGLSAFGIVQLLTRDFLFLVAIAFLIATPAAWFASAQWLEGFAYRITISWWIFLISVLTVFLVAFLTISFQTIKAAISNPVNSLRSE